MSKTRHTFTPSKNKQNNYTMENLTEIQKQLLKSIFERAFELEEKAEEFRGILFPKNTSHSDLSGAALNHAIKEFKKGDCVFSNPND